MDLVLFICSVLLISFIGYFLINKFFYKEKITTAIVNVDNGWYSINWKELRKDKEVVKSLKWLDDNFDSKLRIDYIKTYFSKIHFTNKGALFNICRDFHLNKELTDKQKEKIKRNITASGVLFNFKVPGKLWLMDNETLSICLKYTSLCDTIRVDLDLIDGDKLVVSTVEEKKEFNKVIKCIHFGFGYISNGEKTVPNIIRLVDYMGKNSSKLLLGVGGSVENVMRVMTICHILADVEIPRDWLLIDYDVYNYIKNPHWYRDSGVKHLSMVK